ncbi:hypothetical protein TKK_0000036 [Trichogramma kaykai]|uniref:Haloacid dehalogenase-like hydrolase domain-containing protein 3 n=1 Tax=Trichogramma kaykai TaxID=54128 RepID=A0ABD2VUE3_9HYME
MSRLPLRLITFDVTDTLLRTSIAQHYASAAASQGLGRLDGERLERAFRANYKRLSAAHPNYGKSSGLGWQGWWRQLVHDVIRDQQRDARDDKLDKIADNLIECYSTSECWQLCPGALELLDSLSQRRPRLVLGVVSNFDDRLETVLRSARIRSYFNFVLTSYQFGKAKPNPEIFQEALRLASSHTGEKIEADRALHVGDRLDNDYDGARSANWRAILVNRGGDTGGKPVDPRVDPSDVFKNFDDLRKHFDKVLDIKDESR